MKIKVNIDKDYEEIEVLITAPEINDEVQGILNSLNKEKKKHLIGIKDERLYIINPNDIFYFYTDSKKVKLSTENDSYEIKEKLYEIEEYLGNTSFIRISKSVIINVDKVKNLDLFFNGNLCVTFFNGKQEYVSRKYVSDIKNYLKMGVK